MLVIVLIALGLVALGMLAALLILAIQCGQLASAGFAMLRALKSLHIATKTFAFHEERRMANEAASAKRMAINARIVALNRYRPAPPPATSAFRPPSPDRRQPHKSQQPKPRPTS